MKTPRHVINKPLTCFLHELNFVFRAFFTQNENCSLQRFALCRCLCVCVSELCQRRHVRTVYVFNSNWEQQCERAENLNFFFIRSSLYERKQFSAPPPSPVPRAIIKVSFLSFADIAEALHTHMCVYMYVWVSLDYSCLEDNEQSACTYTWLIRFRKTCAYFTRLISANCSNKTLFFTN